MKRTTLLAIAWPFLLGLPASCRRPIPTAPDREAIAAAVDGFHAALAKGDANAATELLAADAQVLENGDRQTREEYLAEHLPADVEFARAVQSTRTGLVVRQESDVAWTTSTSRSRGTFRGRETDSDGTEIMVWSKTAGGWRIRAIHWSGHPHK